MKALRNAALVALLGLGLYNAGAIAQGVIGVFQAGAPNAPALYSQPNGAATTGVYFGTNRVGVSGHLESGVPQTGDVPVLSACGGATAGDAGSTDTAGSVTQGGTVTTCTITFGTAFAVAPTCVVLDVTAVRASMASATTTTAITITGITASDKLAWICLAKSGG